MRRTKELPTLTVKHIKDVNYVLLQVDCDDKTYNELVKFGRKKILWDRDEMFAYGFRLALEAGAMKAKKQ